MKAILAAQDKGKRKGGKRKGGKRKGGKRGTGCGRQIPFLQYSQTRAVRLTHRLFPMHRARRGIPIIEYPKTQTVLFIPIVGAGIMFSMFHSSNIIASIIPFCLQIRKTTGSKISESGTCPNLMVFLPSILSYCLKECEWRFNNRDSKTQLKKLKQWVKQLKQWVDKYIR